MNGRERTHLSIPLSNISLVARISGAIAETDLKLVLSEMPRRHPILATHVEYEGRDAFLVGDSSVDLPLKVIPRRSELQWQEAIIAEHKIPFDRARGPLIRFVLLHSHEVSDLVVFCQHVICDGLSLAFLARDIVNALGHPRQEVEALPIPPLVDEGNIDPTLKPGLAIRLFGKAIAKKWAATEQTFDHQDFREMHRAFWQKYEYRVDLLELSPAETESLLAACREHGVTVNTVLTAVFLTAQYELHGSLAYLRRLATAVNLRKMLEHPVGEQFGFFAGGIELIFKRDPTRMEFWQAAHALHHQIATKLAKRDPLVATLNALSMPGAMMEAQYYAAFGDLIPPASPSYTKLQAFLTNPKNFVAKLVKKRLARLAQQGFGMGQIITNLGRTDFPEHYGRFTLQQLILMPSCSAGTEIVLGVVTHAGRLRVTVNYMEQTTGSETARKILSRAREILLHNLKTMPSW